MYRPTALALLTLLYGASSTFAQPEVNLPIGNLPPGKTVTVTFDALVVSPPPAPTVQNQGLVRGNFSMTLTGDPDEMGPGDPLDPTITSLESVDLALSKMESADPVIAGSGIGNLTYVVTLTNNSMTTQATNVTVNETLTLPAGVSIQMVTPETGTSFMGNTWTVPILGPMGSVTLTVVLTVGPSAAAGSNVVIDTATITGVDQGRINLLDDTVTESTSIAREVDLQVSKLESVDPVVPGSGAGNLIYTVTVANAGPSDATGVILSEALTLPAGVSIDSIVPSGSTSYAPPNGNPGTWTVDNLAAGTSARLIVTLSVGGSTAAGTDVIDDTATMTAVDQTDTVGGNDSAFEATSVLLDDAGPTVTALSTSAGPLAVCDAIRQRIARIDVTIEDDLTAIQNAGDAAGFLLVTTGPDGDFATSGCAGGPAGDDVQIEIVSLQLVSVQPSGVTAELNLAGANGLEPGLYRFFVCDSVTDGSGNALDGDGDMAPGGDFVVPYFRADPLNLFANGHFDDCPVTLAPWTTVATPPNDVVAGAPGADDADGSPYSASARVTSATTDPSALVDCVAVSPDAVYDLRARIRFDPVGANPFGLFQARCEFFSAASCSGSSLGLVASSRVLEGSGGIWEDIELSSVVPPVGAVSALCDFTVEAAFTASANFDVFNDGLFLGDTAVIFADGFESGDTSSWIQTKP